MEEEGVEEGGLSAMMVLLLKHVHLQKEVAVAGRQVRKGNAVVCSRGKAYKLLGRR